MGFFVFIVVSLPQTNHLGETEGNQTIKQEAFPEVLGVYRKELHKVKPPPLMSVI
jgi:hypothetical protein